MISRLSAILLRERTEHRRAEHSSVDEIECDPKWWGVGWFEITWMAVLLKKCTKVYRIVLVGPLASTLDRLPYNYICNGGVSEWKMKIVCILANVILNSSRCYIIYKRKFLGHLSLIIFINIWCFIYWQIFSQCKSSGPSEMHSWYKLGFCGFFIMFLA